MSSSCRFAQWVVTWVVVVSLLASQSYGFGLAITEHQGHVTFGGLPVPGAAVTATQGGKTFTAITDQQGVYDFPDLADGTWALQVEMLGFATLKQDVVVAPGAPATAWDLKLVSFAEITKGITLTAEAPPVAAPVTPVAGAKPPAKSSKAAPAQPAGGGFQRADVNASAGSPPPAASEAVASAAESSPDLTQKAADGLLINGSTNNGAASPFAQSAAFGNNRRTRPLYTGGFAFNLDNSALDAQNYSVTGQNTPKPGYNILLGGFNIGGPLKIPHVTHQQPPNFFVQYQRAENTTATTYPNLMPTIAERGGDLSDFAGTIIDPTTGLPFTGNRIPQGRISPQATALLGLYPLPNFSSSQYNYQIPLLGATHQDNGQTTISKTISAKNQVFGNFAFQRTATDNPSVFGFLDTTHSFGINSAINWSHRFTQRSAATLKYSFSRLSTRITPAFANRQNISGQAGITGNNQDPLNWGPPSLSFVRGIAGLTDAQQSFNRSRSDQFGYAGSWIHSPHNFAFGADLKKQQSNFLSQQNARGSFAFTGAASGSDFADFLLGIPDTSNIAFGNADKYFRQTLMDAFINDDWRLRSGLTVNAGLRWDYESPITELQGRLVDLNIAPGFTSETPVVAGSRSNSLMQPDRLGFQPRVSLAWRPLAASSLVIRAGYGVYRNTSVYAPIALQMAQQSPLSKSLSVQNTPSNPLTLANGFNASATTTANTFAVDPNFRIGYAQTWNVIVQRDLPAALMLTATYLGTKGTRLLQESLPNTYPAGAVNPCPSCLAGYAYLQSNGNLTRESGQIQLRRRLRSGLTASVLYTFAKSIDDAGFSIQGQGNALVAQNWLNLAAERALSNFDQRQQVTAQAQYTSGMGIGGGTLLGGWEGALLKEWTFTSQLTSGTGFPLTPIFPGAINGTGSSGSIRPNTTGASVTAAPAGLFLNPAAFTAPTTGQWGTAGRNSITGPAQFALIGSISRTFRLNDRLNADVRLDASNVLNHPTFPTWNTTVTNAQFGLPGPASPMRKVQTTVRIRF